MEKKKHFEMMWAYYYEICIIDKEIINSLQGVKGGTSIIEDVKKRNENLYKILKQHEKKQ